MGLERWNSAMSTCFFIGHRETSERVLPALIQEVERHITEYGVTEFVVGHYADLTDWRPMRSRRQNSATRK